MQSTEDSMELEAECFDGSGDGGGKSDSAHVPGIHLNNSFDASMLNNSESDHNKHSLRQVASWDASRPSSEELPVAYSAPKSSTRPRFRLPTTSVKKKLTPASAKRHRSTQTKSPRRHNKLLLDHGMGLDEPVVLKKRAPKDSLGTHTTAASSTLLDETIDSADESSSGAANMAPFRFTSFPASLPRLAPPQPNNDALLQSYGPGSDSVRKRMSFGGLSFLNQQPVSSYATDDFTNNTSLSSVGYESDHSGHGRHGEDDSNCSSLMGTPVLRTRLNFNGLLSPNMSKGAPPLPGMESSNHGESNRSSIFARAFPSCANQSTGGEMLASHDDPLQCSANAATGTGPSRDSLFRYESNRPPTPREMQLHFQLDAAQCSPIPGIPEEDGDISNGSIACGPKARHDRGLSTSRDSSQSGSSARPMPDMHAFDADLNESRDQSTDETLSSHNSQIQHPPSPKLLCPPTPVRTPAWVHGDATVRPIFKTGGHVKFGRANSLVTTKILAMCEPQALSGRASLENSSLEGDRNRDSLHGRELPPPIKRTNTDESDTKTIDGSKENSMDCEEGDWIQDGALHDTLQFATSASPPLLQQTKRRSILSEEELPPVISLATHFDVLSTLGSGAFADVYRVCSKVDGCLYAVKRNRRHFRGRRDRERALSEVKWMQRLQTPCAKVDAANVNFSLYILFFFQAWQEDCHFLVQTELCCRDTLADVLDSLRSKWPLAESRYPSLRRLTPESKLPSASDLPPIGGRLLPEGTIWKICHDVAAGLSHIHSHGLVHYDIKPSNVFFVAHPRLGAICKIGDFGMAGEIGSSEDGQEGDQKYLALETLQSDKMLPSADMFSLGIMTYELASHPTFVIPESGARWRDLRSGVFNPEDMPSCRSNELLSLIHSALQSNVASRPTADAVLSLEQVSTAGSSCDLFLRDYIADIEEFDRREEERLGYRQEDKTPRPQKAQFRICSPSLNSYFVQDKVMNSPEAAAT